MIKLSEIGLRLLGYGKTVFLPNEPQASISVSQPMTDADYAFALDRFRLAYEHAQQEQALERQYLVQRLADGAVKVDRV